MSHKLFLKNLQALSANGEWEAAIVVKNAHDAEAQREANWLNYFAYRTGRLAKEFQEMLDAESKTPTPPPVPTGGGFSIPPPKGRGGGGNPSGGAAPSYA
jgi:hypothetical protein